MHDDRDIENKKYKAATPHADENIAIQRKQLVNLGIRPVEYIPLSDIRAELAVLMAQLNNNEPFDERRFDHLLQCMEWNKEYIAEKEAEQRLWREDIAPLVEESLDTIRSFVPPEIFRMSLNDLTQAHISKDLAKRIFTKHCLWLLRMSASDIGKLHVADLSSRFGVSGQNLDIVELAAVYGAIQHVMFEADAGGKKDSYRKDVEKSLQKELELKKSGKLVGNKLRHSAYRGQEPLFADRSSLHSQEITQSDGAFGPRNSFSSLGPLTAIGEHSAVISALHNNSNSNSNNNHSRV